jgi:hypothetical protein
MQYLQCTSGLVAVSSIVRVSALNTRPTGDYLEIEYTVAGELRETRASAKAVYKLHDEQAQARLAAHLNS